MTRRTKILTGTFAAVVLGLGVTGVVTATVGGDDDEQPIRGDAYDRATTAALEHLGEGRVTGTEVGDEDSLYEVEVTLDSGRQIDVQLDENFDVVGATDDVEETADEQD